MPRKTTDPVTGTRYRYRRTWVDVANEALVSRYPSGASWALGNNAPASQSRPVRDETVTVVEPVVAFMKKGEWVVPTNYRGRPYVSVRSEDGALHGPIDPQYLYPIDETPPTLAQNLVFYGFWIVVLPVGVGALMFGLALLAREQTRTTALTSLILGAAILLVATWWFLKIRAQQRAEGTWAASLRTGLLVGAAIAAGELIRRLLGWG